MSEFEVRPNEVAAGVSGTEVIAQPPAGPATPIVARAGRYYRNARYVMTLGLIIMGGYFAYDGYKGWPRLNQQIAEVEKGLNETPKESPRWAELESLQRKLGSPKSETSIGLQKVLGYALPAAAVLYLVYFLRKSRGEIRLDGDVLSVPGHPPVPLSAIRSVDESQWKKKGIATLRYDAAGKKGTIVLDDFVYQQTPLDAMYDRILAHRLVPSPGTPGEGPPSVE